MENSEQYCCVIGCINHEKINETVQFYNFPDQSNETERRQLWINAIKQKNKDGSLWTPKTDDKICNKHFINDQKSDSKADLGYIPKIFPSHLNKMNHIVNDHSYATLEEPAIKRRRSIGKPCETFGEQRSKMVKTRKVTNKPIKEPEKNVKVCMIGMNGQMFTLPLSTLDDKKSTQTNLNCDNSSTSSSPLGFRGIDSLENEQDLYHFTGASPDTFKHLLSILNRTNPQLSNFLNQKNVLLLFLMKMKIGMPFNVLSVFFNVHRTTISRIFANILQILTKKTQSSIVWFDINSIKQLFKQPDCLQKHHPNTHIIIDIIEIKTEYHTGNSFERKMIKNHCSFKFLLAVNPSGLICFKSKCYKGTINDKELILDSGICDLFESNSTVIFCKCIPDMREYLIRNDICIVEPPFHSHVKVYIDKLMRRFHYYTILKPIPTNLFRYIDNIVHMICVLVNFLIPENRVINK